MSNFQILVDDREKKPYEFPAEETRTARLEVGDYSIAGFEDRFAVERKTFDDLATSVGSDRLRFENEIRRANGYANQNEDGNPLPGTKPDSPWEEFVVVVEGSLEKLYKFRNQSKCPLYYSRIHPNSVIGTVESWPTKYDSLSFVWAGDRDGGRAETLAKLDQWYLKYS